MKLFNKKQKVMKLTPRINKKNGQINLNIPKKKLPANIKKILEKNPKLKWKLRLEGFE